jgi:hypothetical protein
VHDAAVVARLVPPDAVLLLQHAHGQAGVALQQLAGHGEPEDARADHGDVAFSGGVEEVRHGAVEHMDV